MRFLVVTTLVALALQPGARADLVIEQRVLGAGREGTMTLKIKDGRMRADLTKEVSIIAGGPEGESVTVMHDQKRILRMTREQLQALRKKVPDATVMADAAKLEPTDRKEKVGEFETEVFKWKVGKIEATYWVAPGYPNHESINKQLDAVQKSGLGSLSSGLTPAMSDFNGLVVQTEMKVGGDTVKSTITSVKETPVDPKVFELPSGYVEVSLPDRASAGADDE